MQFCVVITSVFYFLFFLSTLKWHLWWGWQTRRHHHTHIKFCTPTTRKCTKTAHKDTLEGIMMLINLKPKIFCLGRNESWRAIKTFVVQLEIGWKDTHTLGGSEWFEYAKDVEMQQQGLNGLRVSPFSTTIYLCIFIYCMGQRYLLLWCFVLWSWSATAVIYPSMYSYCCTRFLVEQTKSPSLSQATVPLKQIYHLDS